MEAERAAGAPLAPLVVLISCNLGNPLPLCAQDKMKQNRMVRLVCVFLHSLLRSNTVNLQVSPDALEPTGKMFSCSILLLT